MGIVNSGCPFLGWIIAQFVDRFTRLASKFETSSLLMIVLFIRKPLTIRAMCEFVIIVVPFISLFLNDNDNFVRSQSGFSFVFFESNFCKSWSLRFLRAYLDKIHRYSTIGGQARVSFLFHDYSSIRLGFFTLSKAGALMEAKGEA